MSKLGSDNHFELLKCWRCFKYWVLSKI